MKQIVIFVRSIIAMLLLSFLVCCHDDKSESNQNEALVGEWLSYNDNQGLKQRFTVEYRSDGTFSSDFWLVDVQFNTHIHNKGTYTFDGKSIHESYTTSVNGETHSGNISVNYMSHNTLKLANEKASEIHHRIVTTYNMQVGDIVDMSTSNFDINPSEYHSLDPGIAIVDNYGHIKAIKRGTTYIRAINTSETIIIRVVVTDPDNIIDDYLPFLGENISKVTVVLGEWFLEGTPYEQVTTQYYNLLDEIMENVEFCYDNDTKRIMEIYVEIREEADMNQICEAFSNKYHLHSVIKANSYLFTTQKEGLDVEIRIIKDKNLISYYFPDEFFVRKDRL